MHISAPECTYSIYDGGWCGEGGGDETARLLSVSLRPSNPRARRRNTFGLTRRRGAKWRRTRGADSHCDWHHVQEAGRRRNCAKPKYGEKINWWWKLKKNLPNMAERFWWCFHIEVHIATVSWKHLFTFTWWRCGKRVVHWPAKMVHYEGMKEKYFTSNQREKKNQWTRINENYSLCATIQMKTPANRNCTLLEF